MISPSQDDYNPGDLVRVWRTRAAKTSLAPERLSYLGLVATRPPHARNFRVRPLHKLGHTVWIPPEQLELLQRGGQ